MFFPHVSHVEGRGRQRQAERQTPDILVIPSDNTEVASEACEYFDSLGAPEPAFITLEEMRELLLGDCHRSRTVSSTSFTSGGWAACETSFTGAVRRSIV